MIRTTVSLASRPRTWIQTLAIRSLSFERRAPVTYPDPSMFLSPAKQIVDIVQKNWYELCYFSLLHNCIEL